MIEISDEVKEAWKLAMNARAAGLNLRADITIDLVVLADFARDQLAARLHEQFQAEHRLDGRRGLVWCTRCSYGDSGKAAEVDKHHLWFDGDWQREAERLLSGEKS